MYRQAEKDLEQWLKAKRRKPLVIRGARQVGKSTLVRNFCNNKNLKLIELNLDKHPKLEALFSTKNMQKIIEAIEDIVEMKILDDGRHVLFLDEIQATPSALACLRYFYEELPKLPVISAGSLLEFLFNDHEYSMPVGRIEFMYLGPMTFTEYLLAKKENHLLERLDSLKSGSFFSEPLHQKALELLRQFLFVGGMPEAIQESLDSNIDSVTKIHLGILETYQDDFVKYAKKSHFSKIQKVFRYVFMNPCIKIKFTNISKDDLSRDLKFNLRLLEQARVVFSVTHSKCSGIPIESSLDESTFKMLALDVGLVNAMSGVSWKTFKNYAEHELLTEGVLAEQFVGQHLLYSRGTAQPPRLNYWLREGKSKNAELDFVVENEANLVAIEVKAGTTGKLRSMHQWINDIRYKKKQALRFNLSRGSNDQVKYQFESGELNYHLITLPLYLVEHWRKYF